MRKTALGAILACAFSAWGQSGAEMERNLERLSAESRAIHVVQSERAREYAIKNNIPLVYTDEFRTVMLVDVDQFGIPVFISTDNANAAKTTNVEPVRQGGALGLNLEGRGMRVGIWDGGQVASHVEFGTRILTTEGNGVSEHSTHVSGTILASGINPSAKGMAPKATIVSYDFNNDLSEMSSVAKPDQTSLILSNHSYGFVTGWDAGTWRGNANISTAEDYRFGFYTNNARSWDLIANNAPYYTMVKSAGNDRNSSAGAIYPADCNGGAGYDCIEEQGTAKNIITVGAVLAVTNYVDAGSVQMSSFSGWGPTDDGRIKPDLVGDGVNVFSTVSGGYANMSGTSMSAPNVTGSLTLLQELHRKLNGGNYMLSSTLKALAIHTTKEAGSDPGPDYKFGWGLLDTGAAAKLLLNKDNRNIYVIEGTLTNGTSYDLALTPVANEKITATLVWNDPAGVVPGASLDPSIPILINDLDMRIIDDQNTLQFPWALDPQNLGAAAFKADNTRDNVEKIEFGSPELRPYVLRISHKRTIAGGSQRFSLIVSYSSTTSAPPVLYWVGNSGNWSDPGHWSLSSGGLPEGIVPDGSYKAIFDENSFTSNGTVSFSGPASCKSLMMISSAEQVGFALNGETLSLTGDLITSDSTFSASTSGTIQFSPSAVVSSINIYKADFSASQFKFNGSNHQVKGNGKIGEVLLEKGTLDLSNSSLQVSRLNAGTSDPKTLIMSNATITGLTQSTLQAADNLVLQSDSVVLNLQPSANNQLNWGIDLKGTVIMHGGTLQLNGDSKILRMKADGTLDITGNNEFVNFSMTAGSTLSLANSTIQKMTRNTVFSSVSGNGITLTSPGNAYLQFDGVYKLCFDNLSVTNVEILGNVPVNAGLNSTLTNAANWLKLDCQTIIVPDFEVKFPCAQGQAEFNSKSQGTVTNYLWTFPDPLVQASGLTTPNPKAIFPAPGNYQVILTVSNGTFTRTIERSVTIVANDLNPNQIILNVPNLFSKEAATSYQWLKNGVPIPNATVRSYAFNGVAGAYAVLTKSANCTRLSDIVVITALEDQKQPDGEIIVFPNPASGKLSIIGESDSELDVQLLNAMGQVVKAIRLGPSERTINVTEFSNGLYILQITGKGKIVQKRIVIRN
jgi:hypothetical protein